MTTAILIIVLLLNLIAPFAVYYAIKQAKKKDYTAHKKIQNVVYIVCVLGVLALEGLIRFSGGSGSLTENSSYSGTPFFKILLIAHIIGAVLTYFLWTVLIIFSNRKFRKELPGKFSLIHKKLGHILFFGLIYTAVTALIVYVMLLV